MRNELIRALEAERQSRVIAYVTDPRGGTLGTVVGTDTVPVLYEHLSQIGRVERIDLLLSTHGGHTTAPYPIVNLLREFCTHLAVLVPRTALSAGTMIALGADEIVMGPLGCLGPVDPTVNNEFNPEIDVTRSGSGPSEKRRLGISVEDVAAYFDLVRTKLGDSDAVMTEALRALTVTVHPLALGNVQRQYLLIRNLASNLLALHMDATEDKARIDRIVDLLTEKLYDHNYQIYRSQARDLIGLPVKDPSEKTDPLMAELYSQYRSALQLDSLKLDGPFFLDAAVIESTACGHAFSYVGTAAKGEDGLNIEMKQQGWGLFADGEAES
ncbi:MAG: hypothetical protein KKA32_16985 [Actinobacteria bacterium]|nr:hypothetical protein [Actinomycetota bacterium]